MKSMLKVLGMFVATFFMANVVLAGNTADITQIGDDNDSVTSQTGDGNDIDVAQDSSLASSSGVNDSKVIQNGDSNIVNVSQDSDGTGGTVTNTVDINQDGDSNKVRGASATVGIASIITGAAPSVATQKSKVGDNKLVVDQDSGTNDIGLYQDSSAAGGANTADFVQDGGDTVATYQATTGSGASIKNDVDVDQTGASANDATNFQSGAGSNSFTLVQHP